MNIAGDSIVLLVLHLSQRDVWLTEVLRSQVKEGQDKQETYKLDGVISEDPYDVVQPFVRDSLKGLVRASL